jgi:hypothetical protein
MFDPATVDTIVALTPFVAFCAFVLVVSGLIAPKTKGKTDQ